MLLALGASLQAGEAPRRYPNGQPRERIGPPAKDGTRAVVRYYPNCQVSERGQLRDGIREGHWVSYSSEGHKSAEGDYVHGVRQGRWALYAANGVKVSEGPFVDGLAEGRFTEWFTDGLRWREVERHRGQDLGPEPERCRAERGKWTIDYERRQEGCLRDGLPTLVWKTYYPNGKLRRRETFAPPSKQSKPGALDSVVEEFHQNGKLLHRGQYRDGVPEGLHEFRSDKGALWGRSVITQGSGAWKSFYPNGRVEKEGRYADGNLDGRWRTYYENGGLRDETTLVNALPEGRYRSFYDSGERYVEGQFHDGLQTGRWVIYHRNGNIKRAGEYRDDRESGLWEFGSWGGQPEAAGTLDGESREGEWRLYYPDGKLKETGRFVSNRKVGRWQEYWPTGEFWRTVDYVDGVEATAAGRACAQRQGEWVVDGDKRRLGCQVCRAEQSAKGEDLVVMVNVGRWTYWHPNGAVEREGQFVEGRPAGRWQYFYDNRQLMLTGSYADGKEVGPWLGYYREGQPRFHGGYQDGAPEGDWISSYPDGRPRSKGRYHQGARVGRWTFWDREGQAEIVDRSAAPPKVSPSPAR